MALIISRFIAGAVDSHSYLPSSQPNVSENLPFSAPVTLGRRGEATIGSSEIG
jgi:hypothetical protein